MIGLFTIIDMFDFFRTKEKQKEILLLINKNMEGRFQLLSDENFKSLYEKSVAK